MTIPLASPVYSLGSWSGNVTDDYGVDWVVEAEDGWSASPPIRPTMEDRSAGDGSWSGPGWYGARVVTLTGKAIATDRLAMLAAKERIKAAVGPRSLATLQVDEAHLSRIAEVRLSDQLQITDVGAQAFDWSVVLVAPDPRRYSAEATVLTTGLPPVFTGLTYPRSYPRSYGTTTGVGTGSADVEQVGDFDQTPAVITFMGPVVDPRATHIQTGRTLAFSITLAESETLVVDLGAKTAMLNGFSSRVSTLTQASAWFMLLPGRNEIQFRGDDPGTSTPPSMTVTARSAWT
jgi:hypothetical protein